MPTVVGFAMRLVNKCQQICSNINCQDLALGCVALCDLKTKWPHSKLNCICMVKLVTLTIRFSTKPHFHILAVCCQPRLVLLRVLLYHLNQQQQHHQQHSIHLYRPVLNLRVRHLHPSHHWCNNHDQCLHHHHKIESFRRYSTSPMTANGLAVPHSAMNWSRRLPHLPTLLICVLKTTTLAPICAQ